MSSADVGASGGYVLFISVLSFILWYRPIYLGFTRSEGRAMAFFFCKLHPPHKIQADDRYLFPICRFPPAILDLHGHRYPLYAPLSVIMALLINSGRICWIDQHNRNVLPGTYRSRYIRSILLNRLDHTSSRRWDSVQEGRLHEFVDSQS